MKQKLISHLKTLGISDISEQDIQLEGDLFIVTKHKKCFLFDWYRKKWIDFQTLDCLKQLG